MLSGKNFFNQLKRLILMIFAYVSPLTGFTIGFYHYFYKYLRGAAA